MDINLDVVASPLGRSNLDYKKEIALSGFALLEHRPCKGMTSLFCFWF